jgi:hypothetical protein
VDVGGGAHRTTPLQLPLAARPRLLSSEPFGLFHPTPDISCHHGEGLKPQTGQGGADSSALTRRSSRSKLPSDSVSTNSTTALTLQQHPYPRQHDISIQTISINSMQLLILRQHPQPRQQTFPSTSPIVSNQLRQFQLPPFDQHHNGSILTTTSIPTPTFKRHRESHHNKSESHHYKNKSQLLTTPAKPSNRTNRS